MNKVFYTLVLLAAFVFYSAAASAHAFLKTATPAVGSTVSQAPQQVVLNFTEGIEPQFTSITVEDAAGVRVDTGRQQVLDGNNTRLAVGLKPLKPGSYKVDWHAVAVDTHKTEGSFTFTVIQ